MDKSNYDDLFKNFLAKSELIKIKSSLEYLNTLSLGGSGTIHLSYKTIEDETRLQEFVFEILNQRDKGYPFKIIIEDYLNNGGVQYKESYGLDKELLIQFNGKQYYTNRDSVINFKTKFPGKPQYLFGQLTNLKSFQKLNSDYYSRVIVISDDSDFIFPTYILDHKENLMKFDIENWHLSDSLMGIKVINVHAMFINLKINNFRFRFYGVENINAHIIDSLDLISDKEFKKITYCIRLCFAFLSGKFYKSEITYIFSEHNDFNTVDQFEFQLEKSSQISKLQLINPNLFFETFECRTKEEKLKLEKYHKKFSPEVFSSFCELIYSSTELQRTLELTVSASSNDDIVQKGALYAVAIETITEHIKDANPNSFNPINDKPTWKNFRVELLQILRTYSNKIDASGIEILTKKINSMNSPTNKDKLSKPFELYGIDLDENDLETLDHRNKFLHGGIPYENDYKTKQESSALKLHFLISSLVLKMINYKGHFINVSGLHYLHNYESQEFTKRFEMAEFSKTLELLKKPNLTPEDLQKIKNQLRAINIIIEGANTIHIME
ncbi:hypothetical protein EG349_20000 (plasmid) [Chryseobacterium shandongense]|jgi:hypothetical protein|uniref:Apea-like HEPN domain-containing protein n=1 Tax=Chryseobacterium shandongense TaxID=1493872 RepID=A0AAD0YH92_9FLAO|nr:hypothetical protein [Chryseobacterium shandongense]AZA89110.1 hypothetical protein EG349_20000 [Chryseobacterium shandongense]AZA98042.1 hypothetical protein EG353_20865 [Chryseobacterium shandongense]